MKNLESHIKTSLENYEAPYNPADWADMENRLNNPKAGKSSATGKSLMIAASIIAVAGLIYYFSNANSENTITEKTTAGQTVVSTQANENSVQKEENSQQSVVSSQQSEKNNSSNKKTSVQNNVSENKSTASEKTEPKVENNSSENKSSNQEQLQPSNNSVPSASFRSDINKVCEGAEVQFTSENTVPGTYKWYFGDGQSSAEQNPQHTFKKAGNYTVKLRVTSTADKKSDEQKNTVTVLAAPSVQINHTASDDNNLLLKFDADADKVTELKWDFGDKQTSSEQNPIHTYSKKGNYKVVVTAKSSSGCIASAAKDVLVKSEINLLAPTGFSPNGDGINDAWMPVALLNGDYIFTIIIYDKSGNVVFTTSDKNHPWDGQQVKTGDTFIWKAMVKDKNGEETNYKGMITIAE